MNLNEKMRFEPNREMLGYMSDAYDAALFQQGIDIMGLSVREVPVDAGHLRRSAYVGPPKDHEVEIGYGVKYAWSVHERVEIQHRGKTKAKFLEDPINRKLGTWEKDMAKKIDFAFERRLRWGGGPFPQSPVLP